MGAEHSQQRAEADGQEVVASIQGRERRSLDDEHRRKVAKNGNSVIIGSKQIIAETASPTSSEVSRPPSPPLSVCSDLPYMSYTNRPIGDSPKMRNKTSVSVIGFNHALTRSDTRKVRPSSAPSGKPKRPQSSTSATTAHYIVVVRPGARDIDAELDADLAALRNMPQFLPVLRETVSSPLAARDAEILERIPAQNLLNICTRLQTHMNACATHVSDEQNRLVERTKIVSNSITTLFATFVDMQKTYAAYAEQFAKVRAISQQLDRCTSLLQENIASVHEINEFLDEGDRLEPFVWRTDDNKLRGEAEGATGGSGGRLWRL